MLLGPEFVKDKGCKALVEWALHGLKSAGAQFRSHLADCMKQLGYKSNEADPDLWMKVWMQNTGKWSWGVLFLYTYICRWHTLYTWQSWLHAQIDKYFPLEPDLVGEPNTYLGAKLKLMQFKNGVWAWGLSPSKYVQEALHNCTKYVGENLPMFYKLTRLAPLILMSFPMAALACIVLSIPYG